MEEEHSKLKRMYAEPAMGNQTLQGLFANQDKPISRVSSENVP